MTEYVPAIKRTIVGGSLALTTAFMAYAYESDISEHSGAAPNSVSVPSPDAPAVAPVTDPVPVSPARYDMANVVPNEVQGMMSRDTVYLNGCSGALIRDEHDVPIGIETAQHCVARRISKNWQYQADGSVVLKYDNAQVAYTGDDFNHLTPVGEVTQYMITDEQLDPRTKEYVLSKDQVFGAFAGHTAVQVQAEYNKTHISETELKALPQGSVLYDSGWPAKQPNNPGPLKRQKSTLHYLGMQSTDVTSAPGSRQTVETAVFAADITPDGATCTPGYSGSEAFEWNPTATDKSQMRRSIGTATAARLLIGNSDANEVKSAIDDVKQRFNVDITGAGAICDFSYQEPEVGVDAIIANVINPPLPSAAPQAPATEPNLAPQSAAIPGMLDTSDMNRQPTETVEQRTAELTKFYQDYFMKSVGNQVWKQFIDGYVEVAPGLYYDRPLVYHDTSNDLTLIGYANPGDGVPQFTAFKGAAALSQVKVFDRLPGVRPQLYTDGSAMHIVASDKNAYYQDNADPDQRFGQLVRGYDFGHDLPGPVSHLANGFQNVEVVPGDVDSAAPQDVFAPSDLFFGELNDPIYNRQLLRGIVTVTYTDGYQASFKDPLVAYDSYYDVLEVQASNSKNARTISTASLDRITIAPDDADTPIVLITETGSVDYDNLDPDGPVHGGFVDEFGVHFGSVYDVVPADLQPTNSFTITNNKIGIGPIVPTRLDNGDVITGITVDEAGKRTVLRGPEAGRGINRAARPGATPALASDDNLNN